MGACPAGLERSQQKPEEARTPASSTAEGETPSPLRLKEGIAGSPASHLARSQPSHQ